MTIKLTKIRACEIRTGDRLAVAGRPSVTDVIARGESVTVLARGFKFEYRAKESVGVERDGDAPRSHRGVEPGS